MELVVLGRHSPFPPARGACPGYWVSAGSSVGSCAGGGAGILLDCGPGVLARFQEFIGPLSLIRSVVLSHLHFDHTADYHVLRYAASPDGRYRELPKPIDVYAPGSPETEVSLISYKDVMHFTAIEAGTQVTRGEFILSFFPVEHPVESYAVRVEGPGGILAYSGDSRPCDGLIQAALGADLFLCEAAAIEADASSAAKGHLTARQAGKTAAQAGVRKLLLTHLWPLYREEELLGECREVFPAVEIAKEGARYPVTS